MIPGGGFLRRRDRRRGAVLAMLGLVLAGAAAAAVRSVDGFPHRAHVGLFPVCEGCHAGISTDSGGDALYPSPSRCAACHDGTARPRVDWEGPERRPSTLRFSHGSPDHPGCAGCHGLPGEDEVMAVGRAAPAACADCHDAARGHPDGERGCTLCHQPLGGVEDLPPERLRSFPRPASHDAPDFLGNHAPPVEAARGVCVTCHVRESCARCHLNADELAAVRALPSGPRFAGPAQERPPEYPTPSSHRSDGWAWRHAEAARSSPSSCANCHARQGCLGCHGGGVAAIDALPSASDGDPRGAVIDASSVGARVHAAGFATHHGPEAATADARCASCHRPEFCSTCHAGAETPVFHPDDFLARHGAPLYSAESECSSCHSAELFCRSCHQGVGLTSDGRLDSGFHDSQPFWLLGHGRAARRGLEGCVSCHDQNDCARCHSPVGGWGVNPHGPGFDADRYRDGGTSGCILCHRAGILPS